MARVAENTAAEAFSPSGGGGVVMSTARHSAPNSPMVSGHQPHAVLSQTAPAVRQRVEPLSLREIADNRVVNRCERADDVDQPRPRGKQLGGATGKDVAGEEVTG